MSESRQKRHLPDFSTFSTKRKKPNSQKNRNEKKLPENDDVVDSSFAKSREVVNFYEKIPRKDQHESNPHIEIHGIKIPFRMLIVGASGSMKTNTALNIMKQFDGTFYHVFVITRNSDEPLYERLKDSLPVDSLTVIEVEDDDLSSLPKLDSVEFSPEKPTLVIFDDLVLVKKQKEIQEFYVRGRKRGISCMYLTQSYFSTPKIIRGNSGYIILKKISSIRDLKLILSEYQLGVDADQLQHMYEISTEKQTSWLTIAIDEPQEQRFRRCYDTIDPNSGKIVSSKYGKGYPVSAANPMNKEHPENDEDDEDDEEESKEHDSKSDTETEPINEPKMPNYQHNISKALRTLRRK